jgi:hypothetical protein
MTGTPRRPWTPERDKELRALVLSSNSVDTIARTLKQDQFCDTSQGKHTQASTEKDCKLAANLIRRLVELGPMLKK